MLIIVLLWSSWLIVSQGRCLASSVSPAVETEMVLHAVLSDMHRKNCTALLNRFPPMLFNIKEKGHSEFSEVSLTNQLYKSNWNQMHVFFFSFYGFHVYPENHMSFALLWEKKKKKNIKISYFWFHDCAPFPASKKIFKLSWQIEVRFLWLSAGSQHNPSQVLLIWLTADWLDCRILTLSRWDNRSLAVLGQPFLRMFLRMQANPSLHINDIENTFTYWMSYNNLLRCFKVS